MFMYLTTAAPLSSPVGPVLVLLSVPCPVRPSLSPTPLDLVCWQPLFRISFCVLPHSHSPPSSPLLHLNQLINFLFSPSSTERSGSDRTRCGLNSCDKVWVWAWGWKRTSWRALGEELGERGAPQEILSPLFPPHAVPPTSCPPPSIALASSQPQDSSPASPTPPLAPCDLFPTSHDLSLHSPTPLPPLYDLKFSVPLLLALLITIKHHLLPLIPLY